MIRKNAGCEVQGNWNIQVDRMGLVLPVAGVSKGKLVWIHVPGGQF